MRTLAGVIVTKLFVLNGEEVTTPYLEARYGAARGIGFIQIYSLIEARAL
jgi:hypothetical protein